MVIFGKSASKLVSRICLGTPLANTINQALQDYLRPGNVRGTDTRWESGGCIRSGYSGPETKESE